MIHAVNWPVRWQLARCALVIMLSWGIDQRRRDSRGLLMPSSIVRNPVRPGDDFEAQQKLELDRLRTAIAIVERMRQAGICCELYNYNDVKNGN